MLRKVLVLSLLLLLAVSMVFAVKFADKASMLSAFRTYKETREASIDAVLSDITFTTDKECEIHYDSESMDCVICFNYTISSNTENVCLSASESSTEAEDDERAKNYVRQKIEQSLPKEKHIFTARVVKDKKIKLK